MEYGQRSFSQKYGYEEVPAPLKLEELPEEARTLIWDLFYLSLDKSSVSGFMGARLVGGPWRQVFQSVHVSLDCLPIDDLDLNFENFRARLRRRIETEPFNKVFDLLEFVVRHRQCPPQFVNDIGIAFELCRLAYVLDIGPPPTIMPAVTPEEGVALVESLKGLQQAGLNGSASHLRKASSCINKRDWAGSVRESIHAVESVARQLDPDSAQTLGPALDSIERRTRLHPALKKGFESLYGYTCKQQGIRHALLEESNAKVGKDEAVFMLGACASFASYLWRKHSAGER